MVDESNLQDEPIEIGGREEAEVDDELELEPDEDENPESDDDLPLADSLDEDEDDTDDDEDDEGDDSDDEGEDDEDNEEDAPEPEVKRAEHVKEIVKDDEVQLYIDDLNEEREKFQMYLDLAKSASPDYLKTINVDQFNFTMNGNRVDFYGSSDHEFDHVIGLMEDSPDIDRATIRSIMRNRAKYQAQVEKLEADVTTAISQVDSTEWSIIVQKAPQYVADNEDAIADWIKQKLQKEPMLAKRIQKFKGKLYLVNEAVKALNLNKKAAKKVKGKKERPAPPIHNKRMQGKGRKSKKAPKFTPAQIEKMSLEEFEKYENQILSQAQKQKR